MSDAIEISALLEDMRSGEESRLISAAPMLAQFGVAAINGLLEMLENPQPLVRDYSAWALGMIGSSAESAIPALCRATQDANSSVRYAAIMALNNIGKRTDEVTDCLLDALADPNEANQRAIRNALKKLQGA